MLRSKTLVFTLVSAALALPVVSGCTASASFKAGGNEAASPPPPPPPPPPPAEEPKAEEPKAEEPKAEQPAPEQPATEQPAAKEPKKPNVIVKGNSIQIPGTIEFETGKATLKPGGESEQVLEQLRLYLEQNPRVTELRIEGHTDNVGSPESNLQLSGQRALTIKNWLIERGIKKERLLAVGFGQTKPIADNATPEGQAKNRRTEFRIAKLNGKPYLGMDPTGGGTVFE